MADPGRFDADPDTNGNDAETDPAPDPDPNFACLVKQLKTKMKPIFKNLFHFLVLFNLANLF